ncbi:hypothetical protein HUA74_03735 [Myxococcus sp. CA051A]|uniref:DUF6289 family protein n=1 Tax=Myxococcus sp. CA051A TaxID=2741739 RepID=UPI00157A9C1E|nr:DUF6289 family protein [Myxococcus sp. CA051A]NTX59765.1 hypothetical protein [Myxococcus sp. CA051A]
MTFDRKRRALPLVFVSGLLLSACTSAPIEEGAGALEVRQERPTAGGARKEERYQYFADQGHTVLVGWRSQNCQGQHASWGVRSRHETYTTSDCRDGAPETRLRE